MTGASLSPVGRAARRESGVEQRRRADAEGAASRAWAQERAYRDELQHVRGRIDVLSPAGVSRAGRLQTDKEIRQIL
jgi:hypothetical protein